MSSAVSVHLLPELFSPESLRGGIAVVIDVLRASSTIAQALSAGAASVVPCRNIEEAREKAANFPAETYLLGGERGGVKIKGFDLGNSPLEYTPEVVAKRTIVFTTTNGTKALKRCEQADRIVIGSFANLGAVVDLLANCDQPAHLVCAGTNGVISAEDVICAGGIVSSLKEKHGPGSLNQNDEARIACDSYAVHSQNENSLLAAIRDSAGGRNLVRLQYDADIEWAARRDRFLIVPEYDGETGRIESNASGVERES